MAPDMDEEEESVMNDWSDEGSDVDIEQDMTDSPEPEQFEGCVQSFSWEKSFGFINSEKFPDEVYFAPKVLPVEVTQNFIKNAFSDFLDLSGQRVTFTVAREKRRSGQHQAKSLKLIYAKGTPMLGILVRYHEGLDQGTILCSSLAPGKKVWFRAQDCDSTPELGSLAHFEAVTTRSGKLRVRNLRLTPPKPGLGPMVAKMALQAAGEDVEPAKADDEQDKELPIEGEPVPLQPAGSDRAHVGRIHSFNVGKGWGFIKSEDFDSDIFLLRGMLPNEVQLDMTSPGEHLINVVGRQVAFNTKDDGGRNKKATDVVLLPQDGQPLLGRVVKQMADGQYGFIMSSSLEKEVYFHRKDVPHALPWTSLKDMLVRFDTKLMNKAGMVPKIAATNLFFRPTGATPMMPMMPPAMPPGMPPGMPPMPPMMAAMMAAMMPPGMPANGPGQGNFMEKYGHLSKEALVTKCKVVRARGAPPPSGAKGKDPARYDAEELLVYLEQHQALLDNQPPPAMPFPMMPMPGSSQSFTPPFPFPPSMGGLGPPPHPSVQRGQKRAPSAPSGSGFPLGLPPAAYVGPAPAGSVRSSVPKPTRAPHLATNEARQVDTNALHSMPRSPSRKRLKTRRRTGERGGRNKQQQKQEQQSTGYDDYD